VTYKFNGFYEVGEQDNYIVLEHDLRNVRPFPHYVTVRSPVEHPSSPPLD
jgi:hypothetical protein